LEAVVKEKDANVHKLMTAYQTATGAIPEPERRRSSGCAPKTRGPRGLDAIVMTPASRWLKKFHGEGKEESSGGYSGG